MPKFFTDDQTPVAYYDLGGNRPPIVFIHGWTSAGSDWAAPLYLLRRKYRCIAIDLRGHGRTPAQHPLTINRLAQDVHQLIQHLGLERPVIVGWSMGALVTFEYLKEFGYRHLAGVVFVDQTPCMQTDAEWRFGLFGEYSADHFVALREWFNTDLRRVMRRFAMGIFHPRRRVLRFASWLVAPLLRKVDGASLLALAENMNDLDYRPLLKAWDVPVLLCYGSASWLYPGAVGEYLRDQLPQARLIKFEKSGHCPPIEEPRKFIRSLDAFMQELAQPVGIDDLYPIH